MTIKFPNWLFTYLSLIYFSVTGLIALLYGLKGRDMVKSIYLGEAEGIFKKVNISGALPLDYYLERADWLVVGFILTLITVWMLLAIVAFPKPFSVLRDWLNRHKMHTFAIGFVLVAVSLLYPITFSALILTKLFFIWLGLSLMLISLPFIRSSIAAGRGVAATLLVVLAAYILFVFTGDGSHLIYAFDEDTFFENLQSVFLFFAGFLFLRIYIRKPRVGNRNLFYLLFALFFFLYGGEEISWGQRIFRFDTPEYLDNAQGETTLHNLRGIDANLALNLIMLVWGILIPLAYAFIPLVKTWLDELRFPVMPWTAFAATTLGIGIYMIDPGNMHLDEVRETFISIGFILFALEEFSRPKLLLRSRRYSVGKHLHQL